MIIKNIQNTLILCKQQILILSFIMRSNHYTILDSSTFITVYPNNKKSYQTVFDTILILLYSEQNNYLFSIFSGYISCLNSLFWAISS